MKLYLIRHGHRGNGEEQDTLTSIGIEEAKRIAKHFKDITINKIICATSNRSKKTAEEIIKIKNCRVKFTSLLNEQSLGILEGKSKSEYKKALEESRLSEEKFKPINGENTSDAYHRATMFVNKLKKEKSKNILIISHAGLISYIITILFKMPIEENKYFKVNFCSVSYFDIDKRFCIKNFFINDTTHLIKESPYYKLTKF